MAKFCNWKNEASVKVMPDILENIEQRGFFFTELPVFHVLEV